MVRFTLLLTAACFLFDSAAPAADFIPRRQSKPPGPPLSPAEAIERMEVPDGFAVELVAAEPDLVNPVAMTIDERGRFWVTESLEYPRRSPGPGRDRVKILEDTDADGRVDKVTVFADGLNIPSGIAVGHGGVWVANAPDILFLQDTDGDGRADKQEVVVSGFGRHDTHELPNSFTWGPDGWLYGLNGVFNPAVIEQDGREHRFTCAMFRIHPRTRTFEVFSEGTSNPWGIAFDREGSAFISACVIDHLWHLTETGYYHRQAGAYPPFTWKLESIVNHKHQLAAYCGLHYFDSDAYPEQYREKLYMGNIHGGCINVDALKRDGATYHATGEPDFLTANDVWFMPVVQKTGPDGCLYILDWYDRYHCYQDANADPKGIERMRGRLYRVRYNDTPRATKFDLAKESDAELIERLHSPNVYFRDLAQRLLAERNDAKIRPALERLVLDEKTPHKTRMHALWALIGTDALPMQFHMQLLDRNEPMLRSWGVRAAGNYRDVDAAVAKRVAELADDPSPDVRLQVAVAAAKIQSLPTIELLLKVLENSGDDKLIPVIVWQNLHPLLEEHAALVTGKLATLDLAGERVRNEFLPRAVDRLLGGKKLSVEPLANLLGAVLKNARGDHDSARRILSDMSQRVENREIAGESLQQVRQTLQPQLAGILAKEDHPLLIDAALLMAAWNDPQAMPLVRDVFASSEQSHGRRLEAMEALVSAGDDTILPAAAAILADEKQDADFIAGVLAALARLENPQVARHVLAAYDDLSPELKPRAIELLTSRAMWAKPLLGAIGKEMIPADALNVNQVRKLLLSPDEELVELVKRRWGTVRTERNQAREQVIAEVKSLLNTKKGDPHQGQAVFKKVCAQCHKIYGEGQEVGPDVTRNGRASLDQLMVNMLDPSRVIGAGYQARLVVTTDGRVVIGLPVEESEQRVVLKVQGGKLETIPRGNIEDFKVSELSMMPEELEKQLKPDELVDLFAFLSLDRPPSDPDAQLLPSSKPIEPRQSDNPADFADIIGEVAPGFTARRVGEGGVELLAEHMGRERVVRTHPVERNTPCVLEGSVFVPKGLKTKLVAEVSHHPQGNWRLEVHADGKKLTEMTVGKETAKNGWRQVEVDLTPLAGKQVRLELVNAVNDWAWEFAFWGNVAIVHERLE